MSYSKQIFVKAGLCIMFLIIIFSCHAVFYFFLQWYSTPLTLILYITILNLKIEFSSQQISKFSKEFNILLYFIQPKSYKEFFLTN